MMLHPQMKVMLLHRLRKEPQHPWQTKKRLHLLKAMLMPLPRMQQKPQHLRQQTMPQQAKERLPLP